MTSSGYEYEYSSCLGHEPGVYVHTQTNWSSNGKGPELLSPEECKQKCDNDPECKSIGLGDKSGNKAKCWRFNTFYPDSDKMSHLNTLRKISL